MCYASSAGCVGFSYFRKVRKRVVEESKTKDWEDRHGVIQIPESNKFSIGRLIKDLGKSKYQLPKFQRNYVWKEKEVASLMDSIVKGYPIGGFIVWVTDEELGIIKKVSHKIFLKRPKKGEKFHYILDGQQRMLSIFIAIKGEESKDEGEESKEVNFSDIKIKIKCDDTDDKIVTYRKDIKEDDDSYISVKVCCGPEHGFKGRYGPDSRKKIKYFRDKIKGYKIPIIETDPTIEVATEIFTRINSAGRNLDIFNIMVAKTFRETKESQFDLSEKWEDKDTGTNKRIRDKGYKNVLSKYILQSAAVILNVGDKRELNVGDKREYENHENNKAGILSLGKEEFIDNWEKTEKSFLMGINYLKREYGVDSAKMLPHKPLLSLLAYFLHRLGNKEPSGLESGERKRGMEDLFWKICFSEKYRTIGDTKLAEDCNKVDEIMDGKYQYEYNKIPVDKEDILAEGVNFKNKTRYHKYILCILFGKGPLSFGGQEVDNAKYIKVGSNEINHHHFFPKRYLKGNVSDDRIDHIGNIVFLDKQSNSEIGSKGPKIYLGDYERDIGRNKLDTILKTHLIDLDKDELLGHGETDEGIKKAYEKFLNNRCGRISEEIRNKIPSLKNK